MRFVSEQQRRAIFANIRSKLSQGTAQVHAALHSPKSQRYFARVKRRAKIAAIVLPAVVVGYPLYKFARLTPMTRTYAASRFLSLARAAIGGFPSKSEEANLYYDVREFERAKRSGTLLKELRKTVPKVQKDGRTLAKTGMKIASRKGEVKKVLLRRIAGRGTLQRGIRPPKPFRYFQFGSKYPVSIPGTISRFAS